MRLLEIYTLNLDPQITTVCKLFLVDSENVNEGNSNFREQKV